MDGRPAAGAASGEASSLPSTSSSSSLSSGAEDDDTLRDGLLGGGGGAFVPDDNGAGASTSFDVLVQLRRLWNAGAPRLREACEDAAGDVAAWTRQGGALRALLVVSVGSASLAVLTGLLVVVFFAAAATTNAIVCSLLVSLVATGGFLAVLLAFLASTYIGALSVAVFVIATTTAATIILIAVATGWAAFSGQFGWPLQMLGTCYNKTTDQNGKFIDIVAHIPLLVSTSYVSVVPGMKSWYL